MRKERSALNAGALLLLLSPLQQQRDAWGLHGIGWIRKQNNGTKKRVARGGWTSVCGAA
jgi:hypothetical protein